MFPDVTFLGLELYDWCIVIGVVMAVYFLSRLIHGTEPLDLLFIGLSTAAVIVALAYFVKHVISSHGE